MVTRQEIGQRVLLRRRELELTQKELAARCGFPYQVICGLERGRQSIYAERLAAVADALQISADYLLGLGATLPGPLGAQHAAWGTEGCCAACNAPSGQQVQGCVGRVP